MTSQVIFTMTSFTITTRILQFSLLMAQRTSCKSPVTFLSCVCDISACKYMHAYLTFNGLIVDTRLRDVALDFKDGGKIFPCIDLINKGKNYSVQVFTTMSGVHGWIGLFDIVFAAYCCGIFQCSRKCYVLYNFPFA